MAQTITREGAPDPAPPPAHQPVPSAALDEVLLTMDAVDAIRHEQASVARDMSADERRAELVRRVGAQYAAQGIEVSDAVIEGAIRAQEAQRYVFVPPAGGLRIRLARLYATRSRWARKAAIGGFAVLGLGAIPGIAAYVGVEGKRSLDASLASAATDEKDRVIPGRIAAMTEAVGREAREQEPRTKAAAFAQAARNALAAGDVTRARAELAAADRMLEELRVGYEVRIVTRSKEASGFWRVPRDTPSARNYYLVVEALGPNGPMPRRIRNEETGSVDTVVKWGVRVPDDVFEAVRRDKQDDGIISNTLVGMKEPGHLGVDWRMAVRDGAVTKWEPPPGSRNR